MRFNFHDAITVAFRADTVIRPVGIVAVRRVKPALGLADLAINKATTHLALLPQQFRPLA